MSVLHFYNNSASNYLTQKKSHYVMSTDAILRKFRLCECIFGESFGTVRSIIFYLHSSPFVSEIIPIKQ